MAFVGASVSADQILSQAEDAPFVLAKNWMRDVGSAFWSSDGTGTGTDQTDVNTPFQWVADGQAHFGCGKDVVAGTNTVHRFVWQVSSTSDFDAIWFHVVGGGTPTSVVFTIADNAAFSTNPVNLFTWTPTGASSHYMGAAATRYTGTGWARLVITYAAPDYAPAIGEIVLGSRRQISRRPNQDGSYDDQPYGSKIAVFEARGGVDSSYSFARGFSNFEGSFSPSGEDQYSQDDITTLRGIVTDSDYLQERVVWVDRPATALDFACFGRLVLSGLDRGLVLPYVDWQLRDVNFSFREAAPFARRSNRISDT